MPYLTTASGKSLPLAPGTYVLGRDPAVCEIVLKDVACSRRHARLSVAEDGSAAVEDLGSRNGTLVEGAPVRGRRPLVHGDLLLFGRSFLEFHEGSAPVDAPDASEATIDMEVPEPDPAPSTPPGGGPQGARDVRPGPRPTLADGQSVFRFAGEIGFVELAEVLQFLYQTHRSGKLTLALADSDGEIETRKGEIVAAKYRGTTGVPAIFAMALCERGSFWFEEDDSERESHVQIPTGQLLFEMCRVKDNASHDEV